jgi:SAM-dependent methyltransferase
MQDQPIGVLMRDDWDRRARENARWYIASDVQDDEEFDRSGGPDVDKALRGLDPQWLSQARALEIGCGAGRMTRFLLPRVWSLCSIDVSAEMIARASNRLGRHPNLQLLATSGCDLAMFADDSFDLVLTYVVLQHIPNSVVRQYFREIRRVLRPGGIFRGQVARIKLPGFAQPPDGDTFSMRSWTPEEVQDELQDWDAVDLEVIPITSDTDHIWITSKK